MEWLERIVRILTGKPGWLLAAGLAGAALALQLDGIIWELPMAEVPKAGTAAINAVLGIGCLVVACFAGHAIWFRSRHGDELEASSLAPLPDRPWEERRAAPVGPVYLRSVRLSSALFGTLMLVALFRTPLIDVGGIIFLASLLVTLTTASLLFYVRMAASQRTG